jgi:phosphate:Na+ symporter
VIAALPFIGLLQPLLAEVSTDPARQVVNFHMFFNIGLAVIFLPLVGVVAKFCKKIIPDKVIDDNSTHPKYLDFKALETPSIALASATRETLRMADKVERMLMEGLTAFKSNDERIVRSVREQDDAIDVLYLAIKNYMAKVTEEFMDKEEAAQYIQILTFATNLEHVGDVIDKNLMPLAMKRIRNQHSFSNEGFREIERIHGMVLESVRLSESVFMSGDRELARRLIEDKEKVRQAEIAASISHIERLREGVPETFATSSLHMDIIRDLRRINTYMCTVAYAILESAGEVTPTRLVPRK